MNCAVLLPAQRQIGALAWNLHGFKLLVRRIQWWLGKIDILSQERVISWNTLPQYKYSILPPWCKGANRCYLWQMITKFFICMCANRFITKLSINAFISLKKFGSALKGQIFIWTPTKYFYHKSGLSCVCVTRSCVGFTEMVGDTIILLHTSPPTAQPAIVVPCLHWLMGAKLAWPMHTELVPSVIFTRAPQR